MLSHISVFPPQYFTIQNTKKDMKYINFEVAYSKNNFNYGCVVLATFLEEQRINNYSNKNSSNAIYLVVLGSFMLSGSLDAYGNCMGYMAKTLHTFEYLYTITSCYT